VPAPQISSSAARYMALRIIPRISPGDPPCPARRSQINFIDFIVMPLFVALAAVFPVPPQHPSQHPSPPLPPRQRRPAPSPPLTVGNVPASLPPPI